ncbi:unnamed protein product [Prunus armeniaca]|nr:hypothetical protein GBA52_019315 [Prunus armeniaca]
MDDESSGVVKLLVRGRKRYRIKLYTSEPKKKIRKVIQEDVLLEILSKLPAKSVLRFRCVSKEWYGLTKSSYFIARHVLLHRSRSAQNPGLLLVSREKISANERSIKLSLLREEETTLPVPFSFRPPKNPQIFSRWKYFAFVGSNNGLVCCVLFIQNEIKNEKYNTSTAEVEVKDAAPAPPGRTELVVVWNPATEQFRYLPPINPFEEEEKEEGKGIQGRRRVRKRWDSCKCNYPLLGFDFLPEISEYKVVRVFPAAYGSNDDDEEDDDSGKVVIFQAQVFLQNTNSWKDVGDKLEFPSFKVCLTSVSVTVNGMMYWLVEQTSAEYYLVSFNLHEEAFYLIPLPIEWRRLGREFDLEAWNNSSVAILRCTHNSENGDLERVLWVLTHDQESKKPVWVQQFRITSEVFAAGVRIVGVWKDQFILSKRLEYEDDPIEPAENLFGYDHGSDAKKLLNHGQTNFFYGGVHYVESLVPV